MSRIGKMPIPIPDKVKVDVAKSEYKVEGPKGKLTVPMLSGLTSKIENNAVVITRDNDEKQTKAFHGLARSLLANAGRV